MKLVIGSRLIGSRGFVKFWAIPFSVSKHKKPTCFGCGNIAHVLNNSCIEYHHKYSRIFSTSHTVLVCNEWREL